MEGKAVNIERFKPLIGIVGGFILGILVQIGLTGGALNSPDNWKINYAGHMFTLITVICGWSGNMVFIEKLSLCRTNNQPNSRAALFRYNIIFVVWVLCIIACIMLLFHGKFLPFMFLYIFMAISYIGEVMDGKPLAIFFFKKANESP